ncbi:MAG: Peptidase, family, catalytic domain protein, partial [Verrucomicrobiales bacterium]|nr:Peptidase, family, catalytic domain protein [Verrucomicrobiales bacterium]
MPRLSVFILLSLVAGSAALCAAPLRVAPFDCDVTPAPGSRLTYDPMRGAGELGLQARGIVLLGMEKPVVLCAVDWIGIANE